MRGVSDRFRSMPLWKPAPIVGSLIGDIVRYLLAAVLVIGAGLVMGFRPEGGVVGVLSAVALLLLFSFGLSWLWTLLALIVRTPNSVTVLALVVLFPLTMASNVFVDPQTMPGWLQGFIEINPISHVVTAVRSLMYGSATATQIGWVVLFTAVLVTVFGPLTMRRYRTLK
jgi:ABC-2 type transport system permease protein